MGEKKPKKMYEETYKAAIPFANFLEGTILAWTIYDNSMQFRQVDNKKNTASLDLKQLTDADYRSQREIVEENKSVAGSAVKGSLIWGQTGALIGAMKAMNDNGKKVEKIVYYVALAYIGSDSEEHVIVLEDCFKTKKTLKMVNYLRQMLGEPSIEPGSNKPPEGNVKL